MMKHNITEILSNLGIRDITCDSRQVTRGSAFFCIRYSQEYIREAAALGASLIVVSLEVDFECNCQVIIVDDVREALAQAAAWLYPARPKYITAVTGTSGKSSVVDYFRQLGENLGVKIASIGTMGICCSDKKIEKAVSKYSIDITGLNTPDVITTYKILNFLAENGVTHVAFEASSHGLDQKRLHGVKMCAAGFVSFGQDHLDYHITLEAYRFAKLKLFSENLVAGGKAIIAEDVMDEDLNRLSMEAMKRITVGSSGDVKILSCNSSMTEQNFSFSYDGKTYETSTSVIGSFQTNNILIAAIMLESCDIEFDDIVKFIPLLKIVPGRLERVTPKNHPWHIFVDYAHKPDAIESVLTEMKKIVEGKLIIVFGCGGDRDRLKRPIMGRLAQDIADIVIVTDDNPRTEDPKSIRKEVMVGCPNAIEIEGRQDAIKHAISLMEKGDILLLAGKGHENYQIIGDKRIPFSDIEEVRKYI
ncbi:MAG: hypothetical protein RLZZ59_47 [Pseudomonadota bacterium]